MDEKVDFGDISTTSFSASPAISKTIPNIFTDAVLDPPAENSRSRPFQAPDLIPDEVTPSKPSHTELSEFLHVSAQHIPETGTPDSNPDLDSTPSELRTPDRNAPEEVPSENSPAITITRRVETIMVCALTLFLRAMFVDCLIEQDMDRNERLDYCRCRF